MKLFIFKPSKFWGYCGGMLIVTATDYIEACERLQDKENRGDEDTSFEPTKLKFTQTDLTKDGCDCSHVDLWVLFRVIDVAKSINLCEIEYNYA